jgi:hypothetical protein
VKADTLLGFITGPTVGTWFMHSVIDLFKEDLEVRFAADWVIVMGPYIHDNRNQLTKQFMDTGRDWFFMVDNDMVFKPEDVFALLREADERGPGIYSAPYPMENGNFVVGPWSENGEPVYHPLAMVPDTVCQVGMVGAGFTLVHRDVFEAVGENPWTSLSGTIGEDVSFCWRAKEKGYIPWLVPSRPGHTKSVVMYADANNTNLHGERVNLVKVDPTDPIFKQFQQAGKG